MNIETHPPTIDQDWSPRVIGKNGGVYHMMNKPMSQHAYKQFIEQLEQMAEDKICLVTMGEPPSDMGYNVISLANTCGVVKGWEEKEDGIYIKVRLLDTPDGRTLSDLIGKKLKVGAQVRGYAEMRYIGWWNRFLEKINKKWVLSKPKEIHDNFNLIGFDAIAIDSSS